MTVFLLLAVALLALGYGVDLYRVRAQRYRLDALRQTLDIEWNAMYQMQRMSQVYLATSEALARNRGAS